MPIRRMEPLDDIKKSRALFSGNRGRLIGIGSGQMFSLLVAFLGCNEDTGEALVRSRMFLHPVFREEVV